jgi:guanosine-3',5'-bis(diphosphate) 3'-pyrophosphohydrolase
VKLPLDTTYCEKKKRAKKLSEMLANTGVSMRLFKRLQRKLDYLGPGKVDIIAQAFLMAQNAHEGQKRRTGEPYITHPVEVACILAEMKMDYQTLMAALLHDVLEDTAIEKITLEEAFGKPVADLVDGVSKLTQIEFVSRAEAQAENFRKMVLAMAQDIRVIIVKLADRLHNMRTLDSLPHEKRRRIAQETLEIFAPIARRLGMHEFSVELEELAFKSLYPKRYSVLRSEVEKARGNRKKILDFIEEALGKSLKNNKIPLFKVIGREKHLYSIYRKMRNKHVQFNDIMDVYAFRIVVDEVDTCYRTLGVVHGLYKPVPERFKDYIAIPKANGYQSLHTTLFGPYGLPIEVQIRTSSMDQVAISGIAAHWLYKSGEGEEMTPHIQAQKWVSNLLELQQRSDNSLEFIESVKVDLFPDEVYVFTPKGEIKELPRKATALDFAYAVHTDVGNHCVGVKVDRQLASLSTVLTNGQTIEVITSVRAHPNVSWLDFVITGKARSGIRHFLKNQKKEDSLALGKALLEKSLNRYSLTINDLAANIISFALKEVQLDTVDELLEEIGLGNRSSAVVAHRLENLLRESGVSIQSTPRETELPLSIKGTEGMVIHFCPYCGPIPGDPIVGILNVGKGIDVHFDKCRQVSKLRRQPERCVSLRWAEDVEGEFLSQIRLQVLNQKGVLAMLSLSISEAEGNIDDISVIRREGDYFIIDFKIFVKNRVYLAKIMKNLRRMDSVIKISRYRRYSAKRKENL